MKETSSSLGVRAIVGIYREFEQATRGSDLSLAQYRLLFYLKKGPQRAGAIAAAGALSKPTVSLTINALREKGWVKSVPDPDGRVAMIKITPAGEKRMTRFESDLARAMESTMNSEEAAVFYEALKRAYYAMAVSWEDRLKAIEQSLIE
jgi:DNA-binding MarR family transcriptional regulator